MSNTINVGGSSLSVTMLGVNSASGFSTQYESGLIGLAPNPMASSYDLSLFQSTLAGADIIPSATMGMAYFTIASGKTSTLYFGGLNPTYASSSS